MKYIPILFSTPMVQALLSNRKTMTRRVIDHEDLIKNPNKFRFVGDSRDHDIYRPAIKYDDRIWFDWEYKNSNAYSFIQRCKYKPGDVLWVRENVLIDEYFDVYYVADNSPVDCDFEAPIWHRERTGIIPCIHMPKEACRFFLQVEEIKVQRLQDISEQDAIAEGIKSRVRAIHPYEMVYQVSGNPTLFITAKQAFTWLWQSINSPESWKANPWVWVIKFKRIPKPENF